MKKPNILWLMSDQHNAGCVGYRSHPNVKTPNLDKIAANGVDFTNGYANNPICSPSRICFMTGQYAHTHRMMGNAHADYPEHNPHTMACQFRKYGYQTALFGKSHMVRKWDEDGFEIVRYTDLCDATANLPESCHYFQYLDKIGLSDFYEEGTPKRGQEGTLDGSSPAYLPYEHSIEHFTGNETLKFLEKRDTTRPFFIHMSFQRPHAPIAPAHEYFDLYHPEDIILPKSAVDFLEYDFAGKPAHLIEHLHKSDYPLATKDTNRLKRCLASYYALISCIDMEIGRVLDRLNELNELENTIVFYTADHGDFAGEHGLFHKNLGIYDSIQRIPFLLKWPGGPQGIKCSSFVESVDLYPTLCQLCDIPVPECVEGTSVLDAAFGKKSIKSEAYCEWMNFDNERISSICNENFRLVYYAEHCTGELFDKRVDHGEIHNLWNDARYQNEKMDLMERLLSFTMQYQLNTDTFWDQKYRANHKYCATDLLHKNKLYWSHLKKAYKEVSIWPPK